MAVCSGCGQSIVWGLDPGGQRIPLDPRPAVYRVRLENGLTMCERDKHEGERPTESLAAGRTVHMVSHFTTCPARDRFSGRNRGGGERTVPSKAPPINPTLRPGGGRQR